MEMVWKINSFDGSNTWSRNVKHIRENHPKPFHLDIDDDDHHIIKSFSSLQKSFLLLNV